MTTGTDETKASKHLILLGRIFLPIMALLALWGMKTVGVMLSSIKLETAESNPGAIVQTIFVWTAFAIIAVLTYRVGVRFNLWKSIGGGELVKREDTSYSSAYKRGGGKRFSLGTVVGILAGLAFLALTAFLALLAWHEFEFGLSNAPERFAARGYVPKESVAAAVTTALLNSEPRIITAPMTGVQGVTNWSEPIARRRGGSTHLHYTVQQEQQELVKIWKDGIETHFTNESAAFVIKFRSITNSAIPVPLREFTEEEWQQFLRERR